MRLLLLGAALALFAGCGPHAEDGRPIVAVSVLPQAWFVQQIAGERVRVLVMVPPGASPATHAPTLSQMRALAEAALYVRVGHPGFPFEEAWFARILAENRELRMVDFGEAAAGAGDPHVWLRPEWARALTANLTAALVELLPADRDALVAASEGVLREIEATEAALDASLGPLRGGSFVVFHPAWGHLTERYGIEQIAIEAGGKAPGPRELAELIDRCRVLGVRVIFAQPHFDRAAAAAVAREVGARVELLDPLAYEWSANLREVAAALPAGVVP